MSWRDVEVAEDDNVVFELQVVRDGRYETSQKFLLRPRAVVVRGRARYSCCGYSGVTRTERLHYHGKKKGSQCKMSRRGRRRPRTALELLET